MKEVVIKCENISKQYRLGVYSSQTVGQDLSRWWAKVRGKEDPFLKVGVENKLNTVDGDFVWALKDIDIDVGQGEVLGIIGQNGAGKSTLLKLLSKVTTPTLGTIKIKGKIASLLEVGTGFHPELTGRENVYLNGAILGMTKSEIKRKFDEIIDFSGIDKYVDTPVKRYSSGMYVRLAFAVAAHLDPDILIVDEVLAVGDVEFQRKSIGKMKDVSANSGRTVIFVSHNMGAINSLCNRCIYMANGKVHSTGVTSSIVSEYLKHSSEGFQINTFKWDRDSAPGDNVARILAFRFIDENQELINVIDTETTFGLEVIYEIHDNILKFKPGPNFLLSTTDDVRIFHSINPESDLYSKGKHRTICWFPKNLLNDIEYKINFAITTQNPVTIHSQVVIYFTVLDNLNSDIRKDYRDKVHGVLRYKINWEDYTL